MNGIDRLHQIAEDVGRTVWLRDLGAALSDIADGIEGGTRDLGGYESDVLAWVEKNGGLEAVKERTMPEDMSWPRYAGGSPVEIGDDVVGPYYGERIHVDEVVFHANGFTLRSKGGDGKWYESDDRFERPAVLASDGEPLEVGQTVWDTNGDELVIGAIEDGGNTVTCRYADVGDGIPVHGMWSPSDLTHQRPVLDADGVPIKVGDTVWHKGTGEKYRVFRFSAIENCVWGENDLGSFLLNCSMFAHTKPEPDSWSSVWADVSNGCETPQGMERRCKALAERCER